MKKQIILKIMLCLIVFVMVLENVSFAVSEIVENEVVEEVEDREDEEETTIKVENKYDPDTNTVTVKIISEVELKPTKPTWKYSEDRLSCTKVISENTTYTTPVEDVNGKITEVEINVVEIQALAVKVQYYHIKSTNRVIASMISNVELKPTKPTWELSDDHKVYSKVFSENQTYTTPVEDLKGNTLDVEINITQIEDFEIEVKQIYHEETNTVTAQIISKNVQIKNTKPTWKLSADQMIYEKEFSENQTYTTPVEDINGNIVNAEIVIDKVKVAKIEQEIVYDEVTNTVTVKLISDIELKPLKPTWNYSEDNLSCTKKFSENTKYSTPVEDKYGNIITVNIEITEIDEQPPEITVEYKYNDDDTVTVYLKSNEPLLEGSKPTWKLSEDKMYWENTFDKDQDYKTSVKDSHGVSTEVTINFKFRHYEYSYEDESTIKVRYLYKNRTSAIVEIVSSEPMEDTKITWELSEEGHKYTKEFKDNNIYLTPVQYVNGEVKEVNIIVNLFEDYLIGADISKHNGVINWSEVKNSGIDFVILRCGYGQDDVSQDDEQFLRNITECERLGIPYGIYLYSYALNVDNALSEADHVLRLVGEHKPEYGIWYDLEGDSYKVSNGMPTNEMFTNIAIAFCEKMKANGFENVGIYASLSWLQNQLNSPELDVYNKWVAQWGANCTYSKKYVMWQYTSSGHINGIEGNVDMDIFYK